MDRSPLYPMFNPESVAIFGASNNEQSVGARVLRNMLRAGFEGDIYPVNPKHDRVGNIVCYPDLMATP
ncbi:MAG: CoA-binding protein, partial [Rhodobiaceae bacterium]|nr:CoA-binding protein [Rhodobiaceae bacterium]